MKVKVVHIVTRLDLGGAQQNTLYTVSHLDRTRFEPTLVCGPSGLLDEDSDRLNHLEPPVPVRFFPDLLREISPARDLLAFFQLTNFLAAAKPEIVHTHSSKAGILGRFAAALAGVPHIVHTFHGFGFHDRMNPVVRFFFAALERTAARFTTRLIFVSKANMEYARAWGIGKPQDYVLIRSGIRLSDYPFRAGDKKSKRASAGVRGGPPVVVSIGNLKPQKNAADFVKVAEAVSRRIPEVSFVFIGDGPMRPALEARVLSLNLSRNVHFLGWRRDVAEILAASDIFLLTSLWEGLPRSLLEAMKSGLPCVAYAVDGVNDVLIDEKNGFAVPAGDHGRAAARVEELLKCAALRKKFGVEAALAIHSEFDIDEMVRSQESLYENLLGAPVRKPAELKA